MSPTNPRQNIVLCCDGTWCGPETGTRSNIQILADAFASHGGKSQEPVLVRDGEPKRNRNTNSWVGYFNGVGTSGLDKTCLMPGLVGGAFDLLAYCLNGIFAGDLHLRCKEAYKFIMEKYSGADKSRIWMFGLSRGAYTVRAVAGMINNCGIIQLDKLPADLSAEARKKRIDSLVDEVWEIFISSEECCTPHGKRATTFKNQNSWKEGKEPPIIFMGLLDTVGAIGLPKIDPLAPRTRKPLTYDYTFRDTVVSREVQHVFQACSVHDRLTPFEPCFVRRSKDKIVTTAQPGEDSSDTRSTPDQQSKLYNGVDFTAKEVWFPGAHYDLGRQDFVFSNQPVTNEINRLFNFLKVNVKCTPALADYPLVGYELATAQPNKDSPCIVAGVRDIDSGMLPGPEKYEIWQSYVKGPSKPGGLFRTATRMVAGGYDLLDKLPYVNKLIQFAGSLLPLPLFQPAYDIEAETKILGQVDQVVSMTLGAERGKNLILRDRHIPLPREDGFKTKEAEFFKVPGDDSKGTDYFSYLPRPGWFFSRTFDDYQDRLAEQNAQRAAGGAAERRVNKQHKPTKSHGSF